MLYSSAKQTIFESAHNMDMYASCSNKSLVTVHLPATKSRGRPTAKVDLQEKDGIVTVWQHRTDVVEWILPHLSFKAFPLLLEGFVLLGTEIHEDDDTISVILKSKLNNKSTLRWIKMQTDGSILFRKEISLDPVFVSFSSSFLWLLGEDGRMSIWSIRYGLEYQHRDVGPMIESTKTKVRCLACLDIETFSYCLIIANIHEETGESFAYGRDIGTGFGHTAVSLLDIIGSRSNDQGIKAQKQTVLTDLQEKDVLIARKKYYKCIQSETIPDKESEQFNGKGLKSSAIKITINLATSVLNTLDNKIKNRNDFEESDWDFIKALSRVGMFSVESNTKVLNYAVEQRRYAHT